MIWILLLVYLVSLIICLYTEYLFCIDTIGHKPNYDEYIYWLQNEDSEGKFCMIVPGLNSIIAILMIGIVIYEKLSK